MASSFILQGLEKNNDHISALKQVLKLTPIERGLIATAFMNMSGASLLSSLIQEVKDNYTVFVGIRNGVTSKQALETLLNNGIFPYVVDTASQSFIFHPKVYLSNNQFVARLIIGSANVTAGGMAKNIEASLYTELSMSTDHQLIQSIYSKFDTLKQNYPDNIFQITLTDLDRITEEGLVIDESRTNWNASSQAHNKDRTDIRHTMRLNTRRMPRSIRISHATNQSESIEGTSLNIEVVPNNNLLWKSSKLTRRDLNIPTGNTTNRTGSMLFKKGDPTQNIDQRFYFRNNVFSNLDWENDPDPKKAHLERCNCKFRFVIKGIDYGIFTLQLSHNTRTDTRAFEQRNSMTQVHWGPARPLVAREDLLNAICSLYAPDENGVFTMVFDNE